MLINITLPVYNEEAQLEQSVRRLHAFLEDIAGFDFEIVIANNASSDRTAEVAEYLCACLPKVRLLNLSEKGRGRAVKRVWSETTAEILSYMDIDLSTDLACFPKMIHAMIEERYDLATGSRLLKSSVVTRGLKREIISRGYNLLIKMFFQTRFSDAQCGFKAITKEAAANLLWLAEDNAWFMDSEIMILAEKLGYRILDLPVCWVDDADSRVRIVPTVIADVKGLLRLRRRLGDIVAKERLRRGDEIRRHCHQ